MRSLRTFRLVLAATGVVTGLVMTAPANAAPITPMIAVTITARAGMVPTFDASVQAPAWTCVKQQWGSGTFVVACTPAAAPGGFTNTCVWNAVAITSAGIPLAGNLYAQSYCDTDEGAGASTPSGTSTASSAVVDVAFTTFYCRVDGGATEPSTRPWTVTCTDNH
jgi:hypothetical protein